VVEMGDYAMEATKREVHNHSIAWTSDHWTGADKATYTTVTVHWIDDKAWSLRSAVLDFKIFEGSTTGERIYEDVVAVLQKYQGDTEDTIVFDTIGITDTTGNMGKLGKCVCVCVFLTTGSEGLPSDAIPIAGRIHPPQRLQRHTPVRHPISLPLGRC
jgi:hypothetical protein